MSATDRKLTKKEKKALAFRQKKGKAKANDDEAGAVPEQEDLDMAEEDRQKLTAAASSEGSKKRKREEAGGGDSAGAAVEQEGDAADPDAEPKKKKRQRGKKKSQQNSAVGADGQPKLLLFVGNLPYSVTVEDIRKHFEPTGEVPTVRLLTPKTPSSSTAPSKGCAFIQFTSAVALQSALRLHESTMGHRKINVELTAGGGGNSAQRKSRIEEKRKALNTEREKAAEKKRPKKTWGGKPVEGGAVVGGADTAVADGVGADGKPKTRKTEIVVDGKVKKVRDRRLRKDPAVVEKEQAAKKAAKARFAMTGANAVKLG